jgi:hypothetical protein
MENIGGKMVICCMLALLLSSCDRSVPISINEGKDMCITTDCGKITLTCSKFGGLILFGQKFEGSFWIQPDSLKLAFSPHFVGVKNLTFSVGNEERKNSESFQINNNSVRIHFTVFSETPVSLDTVTMLVLPCDYIMCNDKPLLTDTIKISLK